MNNEDFIAQHISTASALSVNDVKQSAQRGFDEPAPELVEEPPRWSPTDLALEQGRQNIIVNERQQEARRKENEMTTRMARAVAEAMNPTEVGKIDAEGKVVGVPLAPTTIPESKETIQAGIRNVGIGGRKGVFSELPFDAEDVPDGWEVIQTNDGGYMATPQENVNEVVENERTGKRSKSLGFVGEKEETHDRVVQVKDATGVAFHEETTDEQGQQDVVANALDIAGQIGGSVDMKAPEDIAKERVNKYEESVSNEIYDSFALVEGARQKAYKDSQGLTTVGVGFNMEQMGAQKLWQEAGITKSFDDVKSGKTELEDGDMRKLLGLTMQNSEKLAEQRATNLGVDWTKLPAWHQAILTDIAFNTGSVSGWKKVFEAKNKKDVLRQARRTEGGKNTPGMDNRVARIGILLGVIDTVEQAKKLGLTLTDLKQSEVIAILKKRAKAQPTMKMPQMTAGVRG